ncbi:hypothetical protein WN944_002356 [Citrus x changshan-huyou]|uniref:Uncharacterized protein n=1 Tax=Citrus x changshan-huyou TaxID=2935761 RepID=A0AAP0ML58_9ROSI
MRRFKVVAADLVATQGHNVGADRVAHCACRPNSYANGYRCCLLPTAAVKQW